MSNGSEKERIYEVRVCGTLDDSWFELPPGVRMMFESQPSDIDITVLIGSLDQAALRGLLTRIWDLNLLVLSVTRHEPAAARR